MKHQRIFAAFAAAVALVAMMPSAQAAQLGFYIGGQYGQVDKTASIRDLDVYTANDIFPGFGFVPETGTSTLDDSYAGYGFIGGYRFTPHFAVEGGYLSLGTLKYRARASGSVEGVPVDAQFNFDAETAGIAVSALGIWPLSYRWEVYGRGGVLFASNPVSQYYADIRGSLRGDYSETSYDAIAGIGTSLNFLEIYDLRLEYQKVFDAGHERTSEGDVDMISVGITVVF